jgi:3-hydroxyacyl-CoA dehydrogenase/enoyl-CoA hydratase/3-hydroxybutyryl-CoA epimerase
LKVEPIRYERDADGVVTLLWDLPGRPVNVLNDESLASFDANVRRALADPEARAIIIASAKSDFIAGADLERLLAPREPEVFFEGVEGFHALTRAMETSGKPFVAAIGGPALGGGFEVALACHARIATTAPSVRLGFPEVTLGILPGGGGTQRIARLVGIQSALPLLLEGTRLRAEQAKQLGIVEEIVAPEELLPAAKRWLLANPNAMQPWDRKGFRVPGGDVQSKVGAETFGAGMAMLRKKTWGNFPATRSIMSCVYEGLQLPIDQGLRVEARYFVEIARSPEAKAMVKTLFFSLNDANKLTSRPAGIPRARIDTVGVLGAGMMGAGIAYVTAEASARVVLIDREQALADAGKAHAARLLDERVQKRRLSPEERDAILARIEPTTSYEPLRDADLIIEAVFEDRAIKAEVTRRAEAVIPERAVFGSNTSTLPITGLASASARPANFIGVHFFSPVEKMPLVEVIRGKETSDETLALALDYVRKIRKTPIVVNDSRGFFTSRVFGTYLNEGLALLKEGVTPALIENAGRLAGMAVGPLAVADEVSLTLAYHIMQQTRADLGDAYVPGPANDVVELFATKLDRPGKKAGRGIYDYPADGKKRLWPGLKDVFPPAARQLDVAEVKRRLLHVQTLEALRCFEEGVIAKKEEGDVGSILGWGFPAFTGGVFSLVDYVGEREFIEQCTRLAETAGPRFSPPRSLSPLQPA